MVIKAFEEIKTKYEEMDMRLDICVDKTFGYGICLYDYKTGRFESRIEVAESDIPGMVEEMYKALRPEKEKVKMEFGFGVALNLLKDGLRVARKGWNGKGIYIEMQRPDYDSKMTLPYIYIVTEGLITDNPASPKGVVPWLASQTDMLAEDWYVFE
ncbi:MAG: DUF2829 domain-containing protein [Lentihominibacter sp.]